MRATYAAARDQIIEMLRRDATMHEAGRYDEIGRRFDRVEHEFPRGSEPDLVRLRVALTFWDGWIDARNRGWQHSATINKDDWPALARSVADDLEAERDVTDPRVRARFAVGAHHPLGGRAQTLADRLDEP